MITQLRRAVPIVFEPAPKDRGPVCEDESGNTLFLDQRPQVPYRSGRPCRSTI
jgi:hypothetical protein